jgi:hypothetical protein
MIEGVPYQVVPPLTVMKVKMSTPEAVNSGTSSSAHFTEESHVTVFEPPLVMTRVKIADFPAGQPIISNAVVSVIVFVKQEPKDTSMVLPERGITLPNTPLDRTLLIVLFTNSVVAICVEFVPVSAVGALGVPVRMGDAKGANEETLMLSAY